MLPTLLLAAVVASGCETRLPQREAPELAPYMGHLQRYSQKLGYSIEGRNARLAAFYLEEIDETLEEIRERIPEHDGLPIAAATRKTMDPVLAPLGEALTATDWEAAWSAYERLIEGCNACHAATDHEFIRITPASGTPPFNQRFWE